MPVRSGQDGAGRTFTRIDCEACHRSAVTDALSPADLCALIGWELDARRVWCVLCQWRRQMTPDLAKRLARMTGAPTPTPALGAMTEARRPAF